MLDPGRAGATTDLVAEFDACHVVIGADQALFHQVTQELVDRNRARTLDRRRLEREQAPTAGAIVARVVFLPQLVNGAGDVRPVDYAARGLRDARSFHPEHDLRGDQGWVCGTRAGTTADEPNLRCQIVAPGRVGLDVILNDEVLHLAHFERQAMVRRAPASPWLPTEDDL